jgi:hypothetical protein
MLGFRIARIDRAIRCLRQACDRHAHEMAQAAASGMSGRLAYRNARVNLQCCMLQIADLHKLRFGLLASPGQEQI